MRLLGQTRGDSSWGTETGSSAVRPLRAAVAVYVVLAVGMGPVAHAVASPVARSQEGAARLEAFFTTLEEGLELIPRTELDPAALAATLGSDVDAHLAWVRDHTDWVPYIGALRGPWGVLAERVGNSLDRALLLAEMLTSADVSVRLSRARLSEAESARLLEAIRPARFAAPPVVSDSPEFLASMLGIAERRGLEPESLRARVADDRRDAESRAATLSESVDRQTDFLLAAVAPHQREQPDARVARLGALRDHWWVQARVGRTWIDLDPTLPGARAGDVPAAGSSVPFTRRDGVIRLPRGVAHEVELRVLVEQSRAGRLREREALSHVLVPYALRGRPVSLAIAAAHATADTSGVSSIEDEIESRADQPGEWVFGLRVGDDTVPGRAMLSDGSVATPDMSPGRNRQRLGGALDRLGLLEDAVSGDRDEEDTFASAAWLEFEIRVPGEEPRLVRRALFDLLGVDRGSSEAPATITPTMAREREAALMQGTDVLVVGATIHGDVVADRLWRRLLRLREPVRSLLADPTPANLAAVAETIEDPALPVELVALASQRLDVGVEEAFLTRPNVFAYERGYRFDRTGGLLAYHAIDIVANGVEVATGDAFAARVRQGVIDTHLEALLVGATRGPVARLAASANPTAEWQVLEQTASATTNEGPATARLRTLASSDLADGHVIVAPRDPTGESTWWRIDPATGTTLGMTAGGGQAQAEQGILLRITAGILKHWRLLPCLFPALAGLGAATTACVMLGLTGTYTTLPAGRASIPWSVGLSGIEYLLTWMNGHGLL